MDSLDRAWEQLKREFVTSSSQSAAVARNDLTRELNQSFRRLRQYQGESEWNSALLDGLSRFTRQAAVFEVKSGTLYLRKQRYLDLPEDLSFPVTSAPAFASVIEARDPVVALRTASEVTEHLSLPEAGSRAHLLPVLNGDRVVAVAFAADEEGADVNGLELVVGIASAVLERQSNRELHGKIATASIAPAPANSSSSPSGPAPRSLPRWADLDEKGQMLHVRAQRFARTTVAEMQLARPEACRAGREKANLYLFLKNEIETARSQYRQQFMVIPSMVDYLHLELIRTAAQGVEERLGADYPGQLI